VTTSLLESSIAYLVWEAMLFFEKGELAQPGGSAHRLAAPYEAFPTSDGWITVAAPSPAAFEALCGALGRLDLVDDERFRSPRRRLAHRAELAAEIAGVTRTRTTAEWDAALAEVGVPSGPVHRLDEVWDDPQVQATEMVVGDGADRRLGHAVKLSRTPMAVRRRAPALGADTRSVLAQAGFDAVAVDRLIASGAVAEPAP
jgi:formyl-CoA transferase